MTMIILIGVIAAVGYYVSLRIHPLTKCNVCHGGGRHSGTVYGYSQRRCRKCGGSGRKDRLGVRLFLGGTGGTGVFSKR